jgi:hypothetical protein
MRSLFLCLALGLSLPPGSAAAQPEITHWTETYPAVARIITEARAECRAFGEDAQLIFEPGAITADDLDGDGARAETGDWDDVVVNFNHIFCNRALSFRHGTGGAPVYFLADGQHVAAWTTFGYRVVRLSAGYPAVILIDRHGSLCDGTGVDPCVQAIVVSDGAFYTPLADHRVPTGSQRDGPVADSHDD